MPDTKMRNIVVTGGSRGLGLGIARQLAAAGYRVITVARKSNKQLASAIEEAKRADAGELHFVAFDLSDIKAIPGLIQTIRKDFGPIYGLINNAAIGTDGVLAIMHNTQIDELVRVNTLSPIILTKYLVRSMMADGGGRIVNVASIIGFTGYSGLSVYGATKASMLGFTRSLARELISVLLRCAKSSPQYSMRPTLLWEERSDEIPQNRDIKSGEAHASNQRSGA